MDFKPNTPGVFINYRRLPDLATAGRLFDNLKLLLPDTNVFMDVDSLPAGRDFIVELCARISECDLFLLVISRNWINASDEHGVRRMDSPEDVVRFEIETALRHRRPIIPILVDDAKMPAAFELPASLAQIAKLNAVTVRHESFQRDCQLLANKIKPFLTSANAMPRVTKEELEAFRFESTEAQKLVAERPAGWEYLLVAELWDSHLKEPLRRVSDIAAGLYSIRKVRLNDDKASFDWISEQIDAATGMIDPLQKLMTLELSRAWGEPGTPGDPREILHVCKLMQRAAQIIVNWEENVRSYEVADNLKAIHDLLPGIAARQLEKVKDLPATLRGAVAHARANPGKPHKFVFKAVFDLPDGWEEKFERELRRFKKGGGWW